MLKKFGLVTLCLLAQLALAESYSPYAPIIEVSVGTEYARVKMDGMVSAEGCTSHAWYILPFASGQYKEMYAAMLAAKSSGQSVKLQLVGCQDAYPIITHVYIS